jgi:hypothetical protein
MQSSVATQGSSVVTNGNVFVGGERRSWQDIDRALRSIAKRRGALDAEEAVLLCSVVRREIWRQLGKASLLEYLEDVLGYGPKAAHERVRVALALDELPLLAEALATGEQSYSAIKELTRIATAKTQAEWIAAARGKNVRQIEELVAGRRRGDKPTDAPVPDLKPRVVRFEITTATHARLRHVQQVLADETGGELDDDTLIAAMCDAILDGNASADDGGRARYQILTTVCTGCKQAWQHGGGRDLPVSATDLAIAECDAQRIGSDREPGTAVQDVTPKVRRFVTNRDRRHCTVPGCRAARHIDVHHIVPRYLGGGHEPENLTLLLCSGHHRALHEGYLIITGRAPELEFEWTNGVIEADAVDVALTSVAAHGDGGKATGVAARGDNCEGSGADSLGVGADNTGAADGAARGDSDADRLPSPHVGREACCTEVDRGPAPHPTTKSLEPSNYEWTVKKTEVTAAMKQMGFARDEARALVEQAAAPLPRSTSREDLLRKALQIYRRSPAGACLSR